MFSVVDIIVKFSYVYDCQVIVTGWNVLDNSKRCFSFFILLVYVKRMEY